MAQNAAGGRKKRKFSIIAPLMKLAFIAFVAACLVSIISTQSELSSKKEQLDTLRLKAQQLEAQNGEYGRILSEENEREYMEKMAIDKLGYAFPGERRFYDTSRD